MYLQVELLVWTALTSQISLWREIALIIMSQMSQMSQIILIQNLRMSPLSRDSAMDGGGSSKRRSPAATMAEASLLALKAAMEEAKNAAEISAFQREDLIMRADELKAIREERITKAKASRLERKTTAKVLQKIVEKLCPEEDPTDKFTARKRKLEEAQAALGEELYHMKVQQLKDEFMKTSAI
jgi:hypothetical protein